MPNNPRLSQVYDSYSMLHPDGKFMCFCNKKRAMWYINKGLATWVDDKNFKLKFEPQGHGKLEISYYQQKLENKCVVCGALSNLNKHHVFPYVFRSRLPSKYKESNHHDILPICTDCHEKYEEIANTYKLQLAKYLGVPMNKSLTSVKKNNRRILSARKAIEKFNSGILMPEERVKILQEQASQDLIKDDVVDGATWADKIMEDVLSKDNLQEFICSWRSHLVKNMNPQFLPKLWSINHPLEVIG